MRLNKFFKLTAYEEMHVHNFILKCILQGKKTSIKWTKSTALSKIYFYSQKTEKHILFYLTAKLSQGKEKNIIQFWIISFI